MVCCGKNGKIGFGNSTKRRPTPLAVDGAVAPMISGAICLSWLWLEDDSEPSRPATEAHVRRPRIVGKVLTVMKRWPLVEGIICVAIALLVAGCAAVQATPTSTHRPTLQPTCTSHPTEIPSSTPDPTQEFFLSCVGWQCSLEGVVYRGTASPGNELAGIVVRLSHHSFCSPTSGEHETTTGADGEYSFPVYVHDTDTFWIEVELGGYEPVRQSIGGFDCLSCSCPPMEIVLRSEE